MCTNKKTKGLQMKSAHMKRVRSTHEKSNVVQRKGLRRRKEKCKRYKGKE